MFHRKCRMWHIRERARLSSPSLESSEQLIFFATFWRRCPEGAAFDPTNGLITQLTKTALSWDSRAPCSLRFLTPNLLKTNYGGLPCRCDRVLLALLDGHSPIRSRWSTVAFAKACGPTLKSRSTAHAPKGLWLSAIQPEGLFLLQHDVDRPASAFLRLLRWRPSPPPLAHLLIESRYGRIVPPNVDAGALDHYPVHHRVSYALRGVLCLSRLTHPWR